MEPDWPSKVPCRLAFVAEAPGDEEMDQGKPLVGPSGKVFNAQLRTAGIERSECLVTNLFDTQLPDNDVDNWCGSSAEMREWRQEGRPGYTAPPGALVGGLPPISKGKYLRPEHVHHLDRLKKELEKVKPTVIVPLGGTALWAFTGFSNIMARRGAADEAAMVMPGTKLIPTVHPAHVIRNWKWFPMAVADMMKAWNESAYPEVRVTESELWLEPTLDDIRKFKAKYLDNAPTIYPDIETGFGQITCIGFADGPYHAICIPFWDDRRPDNSCWALAEEEYIAVQLVRKICELPQPKCMQNGSYDAQWIFEDWGITVRNYSKDTRLKAHALWPELEKDLGTLGATHASRRPWKTMRTEKAEKRDE